MKTTSYEMLSNEQWKNIFYTLCDGEQEAALHLTFMKQFKNCVPMFFWLRRNRIQGKKLVDLFKERGNLGAVQYINDRMSGREFTSESLKVNDLC